MPSIAFKLITEKTEIVYKIAVNPFVNTNLAEIIIFIENRPIKALLDLGATKSVINGNLPCFSDFTRKNPIHPNSVTLQCADGNILPNDGLIDLMVKLNTFYSSQVNFIVSKYLSHNCILGTDFIESLNYSKDKPYVYLNGHKLRRYMPKIKPLIIRVSKDINLEPHCRDQVIKIKNPLYNDLSSAYVYLETPKQTVNDQRYFSISDAIYPNSEFLEILISNFDNRKTLLARGTHIGQLSPCFDDQVFTLSVAPDTNQETLDLESFQNKRRQKYNLDNHDPKVELNLNHDQELELRRILRDNNLAFAANSNDLGRIAYWRYSIPFYDENSECYQPPRPIPPGLSDKVRSEFENWKDNDLVEEAYSPVNIPVLIVKKPNGDVRLALDARKLNALSIKDRFPMPNISSIFYTIGNLLSKAEQPFISSFDAKRAYNQLLLSEKDRNKVAFSLFNRHYRAKRLIYGFQNGPAAFCRLMSYLFADDDEIYCFIDDIIVISPNWESHKDAIKRLLDKCIKIGLVLDPSKSQIGREEVTFLGETLTKNGRKPCEKHIKAITEYPVPKTRKELRRFCGLCVFEQKFIENSSITLEPLHKLAGAKSDFIWTDTHQHAFEKIKSDLRATHGIVHRNEKLPLILTTDASLTMAAGILSQINSQGDYEPLGYFSRKFTPAEQRQSSRHREAYAIHDACKHFQFLLLGQKFEIETDHHSLIWLAKENLSQTLNSRMVNVYQFLAQFDFTIRYRPNNYKSIIAADALSRIDEQPGPKKHFIADNDPSISLSGMNSLSRFVNQSNSINQVFMAEHFQINAITRAAARKLDQDKTNQSEKTLIDQTESVNPNHDIFFRFGNESYSRDHFLSLQRKDKFISRMKVLLNCICKRKPSSKRRKSCLSCKKSKYFHLDNDLLYQTSFFKKRLIIPDIIADDFINFLHVSHLHPGAKALEKIIRSNVFIKNIQSKCQDICRRCITCKLVKPSVKANPGMINRKPAATYPFEYASLDLIDHGKADSKGYRYLLVLNDSLTDFIDGTPLRSKSDREVSKAIRSLMLSHGALSNIMTDNGGEFGPLLRSLTTKLNMGHIYISPYNSRANRVERSNRCIRIKERLLNLSEKCWSEAWPLIKFHLNHSPKDKLDGKTPFEAAYGRSIYLPYTNESELLTTKDDWTKVTAKYFTDLYPELVKFQNDRIMIRNQSEKNLDLPIGSEVLIFKPSISESGKIGSFWDGPLTVIKKSNQNSYLLRCKKTRRIFRRHRRHIRRLNQNALNPPQNYFHSENLDSNQQNPENTLLTLRELPYQHEAIEIDALSGV